ncbi:activating transcription factor-2 isoform X2 [Oratosquilla oratoria]|uniref:activating transcription factor-2 isoform X2 n=1 Tax=Oratosquilla oratoria TaxID=337810 RepID=UPI003F75BF6F
MSDKVSKKVSIMGEVDKPFGCSQPGCGMSFTNEDHLMVHQRRHDMQLSIGADHSTPSLARHAGFGIDQTPTPTRFLRQCDEVGLFQDINLNPFDEQFRRASQLRIGPQGVSEAVPLAASVGESLDTPRIMPPVDSDETISSTSRDDLSHPTASTSHPSFHCASISCSNSSAVFNVQQSKTVTASSSARVEEIEDGSAKSKLSINVTCAAEAADINATSVISTPTPVITAGPSVTQSLPVSVSQNTSIRFAPQPSSVPPSPSATVLQLLLRLPDGQAIPVEIPATPVVSSGTSTCTTSTSSTSSLSSSSITGSGGTTSSSEKSAQSFAKLKLKQVLASSSNTAARPGTSKASKANTADRIAEMTRNRNPSGTSSVDSEYGDDYGGMSGTPRRRRHSSADEDPALKRKKFLERNRAAAIRCREKKKKWIKTLAAKSDELNNINLKLQGEVSSLRAEVAALKSMLLQHKDCPVTLAMQEGSEPCENQASLLTPRVLPPTSHNHKRTRSLSLPSISPSTDTSAPINLSNTSIAVVPTGVPSPSSSSSSSSSISNCTQGGMAIGLSTSSAGKMVASPSSGAQALNLSSNLITTSQPRHILARADTLAHQSQTYATSTTPYKSGHVLVGSTNLAQIGDVSLVASSDVIADGESNGKTLLIEGSPNVIVTGGGNRTATLVSLVGMPANTALLTNTKLPVQKQN